jgi:hypothetical protein
MGNKKGNEGQQKHNIERSKADSKNEGKDEQ